MFANKNEKIRALKSQKDAVINYIKQLDIDMISTLLEDGKSYQEMEKHIFIRKLGYSFAEFTDAWIQTLSAHQANAMP